MKHFFEVLLKLFKHICFSVKFVLLGFHVRISNDNCDQSDRPSPSDELDNTITELQQYSHSNDESEN